MARSPVLKLVSSEFPSKISGDRHGHKFVARITPSEATTGKCPCGGNTVRSWRTGILHKHCFDCRYLRMIYGTSIEVTRLKTKS